MINYINTGIIELICMKAMYVVESPNGREASSEDYFLRPSVHSISNLLEALASFRIISLEFVRMHWKSPSSSALQFLRPIVTVPAAPSVYSLALGEKIQLYTVLFTIQILV